MFYYILFALDIQRAYQFDYLIAFDKQKNTCKTSLEFILYSK